jgi:hypothetical protein
VRDRREKGPWRSDGWGVTVGTDPKPPEAGGAQSVHVLHEIGEERGGPVGRLPHGPTQEVGPIGRFKRVQTILKILKPFKLGSF